MKKSMKIFMALALALFMTLGSFPVNTVRAEEPVTEVAEEAPKETDGTEQTDYSEQPSEGTEAVAEKEEGAEQPAEPAEGETPAEQAEEGKQEEAPAEEAEQPADPAEEDNKQEETPAVAEAEEETLPEEQEEAPAEEELALNSEAFGPEVYTVGDLKVTISYPANTVPEGTEVVVTDAKPEALEAIAEEKGEDAVSIGADISFWYDGKEIEPADWSDENQVSVSLEYIGEEEIHGENFETLHVAETRDEEGNVASFDVEKVDAKMVPVTKEVPVYETREIIETVQEPYEYTWNETVTKYKDVTVYEDVQVSFEEEVPVYETRDITEEKTTYVTKTREVEKTRTVRVKVAAKWYDPSTWLGYKNVKETYTATETYKEPVTYTVVVGTEKVQVGTETVTKYRTEKQPVTKTVEDGTETITHTETRYREASRGTGEYETVKTDETEVVVVDLTASFEAREFTTFTITWRGGGRTVTVHYVDENGNELTVSNPNSTHPNMNANSSSPAFLIYDIDDYEYSYTYLNTNTNANRIAPILAKNGNNRWMYNVTRNVDYWGNFTGWSGTELSNNDNIYVVYKAKTQPTKGGTVQPPQDTEWPTGDGAPKFGKSSTHNNDGTNTVALTIAASEKEVTSSSKANVIVVLDVSASMSTDMNGLTRMIRARDAVRDLADLLLNKTDPNGNKLVKMALITFGGTANTVRTFVDNPTTFKNAVPSNPNAGNTYNGATNWEQALYLANHMEVDSDAATYIIFVTDGDPTFRMTRGDITNAEMDNIASDTYVPYREAGIFGEGNGDTYGRNFDATVPEVRSIISNNKNFYAIGVSNDVTKVQTLCTESGVPADHAYRATDSDQLEEAFNTIASSISTDLGFGDVSITDEVTEMSSTRMEMLHSVDSSSFKYYKIDSTGEHEWTTREADGCAPATYDEETGAVEWNMGSGFQLEDGVTYKVTFTVWPSQDAYDLVAELNNGTKVYAEGQPNSISADQREQIEELAAPTATTQGSYALKTNTDNVKASYKKTTKSGDVVSIADEEVFKLDPIYGTRDNMTLESMKLTVKKEFEDDLTGASDRDTEITLVLHRRNAHQDPESEDFVDFEPYAVPQADGTSSPNIVLNDDNNWTYSLYVAPGFEVNGEVLEHGYEFTITEPSIDYHYDLIEEIINPMVVDGRDKFYGDGYLIDDDDTIAEYVDESLTAVNRVKSGIDIRKLVIDDQGNPITSEEEFTIKGKILDENGNPYTWQSGDDVNKSGAYHKYVEDSEAVPGQSGAIEAYGKTWRRIVYKGHFESTDNIEFTLKPNELIRFINVPENCTFEFEEDKTEGVMPADFEWDKSEGTAQHKVSVDGEFTTEGDVQPAVTEDGKVYVTKEMGGVYGNKQYTISFTNKSAKGEVFYVYHSSDNTVEKIYSTDERVEREFNETTKEYTYTFNIFEETKFGTLYGGYYKAYKDQASAASSQAGKDADVRNLTYDEETNWATDSEGAKPYDAKKANVWVRSDAYTELGTAMHPTANTVYYLKEVPSGYIRPYVHYTYDNYDPEKPIKRLYIITATDDTNYKDAGYLVMPDETEAFAKTVSMLISIKKPDGTVDTTLTAKKVFGSLDVTRGYLYWDDCSDLIGQNSFKYVPCWETLDGVLVKGIKTRTVTNITTHIDIYATDEATIK